MRAATYFGGLCVRGHAAAPNRPNASLRYRSNRKCVQCTSDRNRARGPQRTYASTRPWRDANPDKVREYRRRWRQKNPEAHAEIARRWRAKRKARKALLQALQTRTEQQ